jgi:hypothetical protein
MLPKDFLAPGGKPFSNPVRTSRFSGHEILKLFFLFFYGDWVPWGLGGHAFLLGSGSTTL